MTHNPALCLIALSMVKGLGSVNARNEPSICKVAAAIYAATYIPCWNPRSLAGGFLRYDARECLRSSISCKGESCDFAALLLVGDTEPRNAIDFCSAIGDVEG